MSRKKPSAARSQTATVGQLKRSFKNRTERNKRRIEALGRRLDKRCNELEQFIIDLLGGNPAQDQKNDQPGNPGRSKQVTLSEWINARSVQSDD